MWSIEECKSMAWARIKLYYWPAIAVSFIYMLLSGGTGGGASQGTRVESQNRVSVQLESIPPATLYRAVAALLGVTAVMLILVILFQTFIGNPILVGKNRFFMESRALGHSAGVGKAFWVFSSGCYFNVVKIMFLKGLFTCLWSCLLVIPGIVKDYEYAMIPYILSENPQAHWKDAFALTKDMMSGGKFQLFLFQLSFIGWYLLVTIVGTIVLFMSSSLGIIVTLGGCLLILPYVEAACAEVYGILRTGISGYPFNGYGVPESESQESGDSDDSNGSGDYGGLI